MAARDIVVIGASAGGIAALQQLVSELPTNFAASVFVVLHMAPQTRSRLPEILGRSGPLPVKHPSDGEEIRAGHIYVALPDHHLLLDRGRIRVVRGARENNQRPAIDALFRSAAQAYGPRVVGVVLTGFLDDGSAGLIAIRRTGGVTVVQDPNEAAAPDMPLHAMEAVKVDHVLPLARIPPLLNQLATTELVSREKAS